MNKIKIENKRTTGRYTWIKVKPDTKNRKLDKLNDMTRKIILELAMINNDKEFEKAVTKLKKQYQELSEKERLKCEGYYSNIFEIAKELRSSK